MQIELTEQDVQNLQVSVLQMAKSAQADAQAMKVLVLLHDKLDKALQKETVPAAGKPANFKSTEFQEAAAEMHQKAVEAKQSHTVQIAPETN